jgi:hypothetical protein
MEKKLDVRIIATLILAILAQEHLEYHPLVQLFVEIK